MSNFYTKVTPILVIVNFLLSSEIFNFLLPLGYWRSALMGIICITLAIFIINLLIIIRAKKKYKSEFSPGGYVIFVVVLPCVYVN